jgi:dolichyl-diphosphooligosaccharide--protein glycosyltransferase
MILEVILKTSWGLAMSDKELQSFLKNLKNKKEIFLLLIPIVLGLYLRAQTLNWHRLWAYDPYFYYRQAVYFANGGSIHDVDTLIVTTIRRFSDNEYFLPLLWAYLGKIFHIDLWTLGIYLPLIIFVFQIIVVYKIGKDAFNWKVGFFASLFLSVMGAHVYRTHAGGIWKDTLGSLFMLMFLHAVILILKERELDIRKAILYGAYLTLSLYLSIITFDGFGEFSLVVSIYLILSPLISKPRKNEFFIATLMIPALLLGGMSVGTYWPWSDYRLKEIYLFIPFLMASIFALISLAVGVFVLNFVRHERKGKIIYSLLLVSEILGALYFFWKFHQNPDKNSLWYPIYRFVNYLLNPEEALLSAQSRATTPDVLWLFFSVLLAFALLGGIVSGYYVIKSSTKGQKRLNLLFLILFATGTFLGIATIRLTYLMSFGVAFSSAIFFDYLAKVLQLKLPDKNKVVAILLIVLLIATVPTFIKAKQYASMPPIPNTPWLDAVQWMGNNIKGQVVFNWWDWGHWIQAFSVKTTSDNIYQRGNEYAWFVKVNEKESAKLLKRTQELARRNTGKNITINYVVIGQDLLLKLGTLNRYYSPDKKIEVYPFKLERALGNTRIYSTPNAKIIVKFEKNTTKATLVYGNVKRELKNIVVEIPSKQNLVFNYGQEEYITYVTPFACFLVPSALKDTMLVKLLIFEQSEKYRLVYDNGYVKIYKISKV